MGPSPRITMVTPSFEPGRAVVETVESVAAQGYPDVEHIVLGPGLTEEAGDHRHRPTHLKLVCAPALTLAEAVNRAFELATGDIWGILCPGDILLPGALARVAREVDPARGRHVVMGRGRLLDADGRFFGIEHASRFESRRRVLEVWRGHTVPRPSLFWAREVWARCGGMDADLERPWLDYDLICRFAVRHRFQPIDQPLAACPLESDSNTARCADRERLEETIEVSRRYWGSRLRPAWWRLWLSLGLFRLDRVGRARRYLRTARAQRERPGRAGSLVAAAVLLAPGVAVGALAPLLRDRARALRNRALAGRAERGGVPAETLACLERTEAWSDGWVGPRLVVRREGRAAVGAVTVRGWTDSRRPRGGLVITVRVDGEVIGSHPVRRGGHFVARFPIGGRRALGAHVIEVESSAWFVPQRSTRSGDLRPLSWRLGTVDLDEGAGL